MPVPVTDEGIDDKHIPEIGFQLFFPWRIDDGWHRAHLLTEPHIRYSKIRWLDSWSKQNPKCRYQSKWSPCRRRRWGFCRDGYRFLITFLGPKFQANWKYGSRGIRKPCNLRTIIWGSSRNERGVSAYRVPLNKPRTTCFRFSRHRLSFWWAKKKNQLWALLLKNNDCGCDPRFLLAHPLWLRRCLNRYWVPSRSNPYASCRSGSIFDI